MKMIVTLVKKTEILMMDLVHVNPIIMKMMI